MGRIIKTQCRAYRYIAAGQEDWLYPEEFVSKSEWNTYGDGLLLMPDPRTIHHGGEVILGFKTGPPLAYDEYGQVPGQPGHGSGEGRKTTGYDPLYRFQGEFAQKFGPKRRGRTFDGAKLEDEEVSPGLHEYFLELASRHRRVGVANKHRSLCVLDEVGCGAATS